MLERHGEQCTLSDYNSIISQNDAISQGRYKKVEAKHYKVKSAIRRKGKIDGPMITA